MLTFELTPDLDELEIHTDREGLRNLLNYIRRLMESDEPLPRHDHLMTPSWGGHELTEEAQTENGRLLNHVKIHLWN
jgi:hypothetical protein